MIQRVCKIIYFDGFAHPLYLIFKYDVLFCTIKEIVLFTDGNIALEVPITPEQDTVCHVWTLLDILQK